MNLHIFSYGEDQAIDGSVNKKFNNTQLTNHDEVMSLIYLEKLYRVISYDGNNLRISFQDLTFTDDVIKEGDLKTALLNLYNEIINK